MGKENWIKRIGKLGVVLALGALLAGCRENPSEKGVEYLKEGNYEKAITQFEKAIQEKIKEGDAYRGIGIARYELGNYKEAKEALLKALEEGEKPSATFHEMLGDCELNLGEPRSALNYYRLALEGDLSKEARAEVLLNEIAAYEQLKDWKSAKAKLEAYVKEYPDQEKVKKELEFLRTRDL